MIFPLSNYKAKLPAYTRCLSSTEKAVANHAVVHAQAMTAKRLAGSQSKTGWKTDFLSMLVEHA